MSENTQLILCTMFAALAFGGGWLIHRMFMVWMASKPKPVGDNKSMMAAWEQVEKLTKEVEDLKGRVNGITLRMGLK